MQYSAELLPTVLRGRGLAFLRFMGTLGLYLSPSIVYLVSMNTVNTVISIKVSEAYFYPFNAILAFFENIIYASFSFSFLWLNL